MTSFARKLQRAKRRDEYREGRRIINSTPITFGERPRIAGIDRPDGINEDISQPIKPDKGLKGGSCNRTACQAPGAMWFNHSTRAYYCQWCARLINESCRNDDYVKGLGHDLLTLDLPEGSHPTASNDDATSVLEGDNAC
jgi:hypothetical protein